MCDNCDNHYDSKIVQIINGDKVIATHVCSSCHSPSIKIVDDAFHALHNIMLLYDTVHNSIVKTQAISNSATIIRLVWCKVQLLPQYTTS